MNNRNYRVIFSKAKNMLVVVSEATRSQGKSSNASIGGSSPSQVSISSQVQGSVSLPYGKFASLAASILLSVGLASISHADGQIRADKQVDKNQQATVLKASNGVPQVDIQTPSTAGVSRNVFSQFDVTSKGAIINNSRENVQTQLGGWVKGNPWLSKGEARVIVNEVNSSSPSMLNGYTEIAGQKAELVIANPSGITCSGCGFINANRTALTTGVTKFGKDGELMGLDVSRGHVQIDGKGLRDTDSNYTQIISKTVELNAGVHAKNLDVIFGENSVSYEDDVSKTKTTGGSSSSTGVALDVSNLGGMYAGKIRLIGTDKGMGVTNAGNISSNTTLTLDAEGNLVNKGRITAKQQVELNLNGNDVDNEGTIASNTADLTVKSQNLKNSGVINSRQNSQLTQSKQITNTGLISSGQISVNADTLDNTGSIQQTGSGKLLIDADSLDNKDDAVIGQALYKDKPATTTPTLNKAPSTASSGSQGSTQDATTPSQPTTGGTNNNTTDGSTPTPTLPAVTADGSIVVKTLKNTSNNARIRGNNDLNIHTANLTNDDKSSIVADQLTIKPVSNTSVVNNDSRMQIDDINWQLQTFTNTQGTINSLANINISSNDSIDNTSGQLIAKEDIAISSKQNIDNTSASISAGADLSVDAGNTLSNSQGSLSSAADMTIKAGDLQNGDGKINSQATLNINNSGSLNSSGQIYSGDGTTINSNQLDNSGIISSQKDTSITANNITNTGILAAGTDTTGKLTNGDSDLSVTARQSMTSSGTHIATGKAELKATNLDLSQSSTQGTDVTLKSSTDLSTENATVTASDTLSMSTDATILNHQGKLSAKTLTLNASRLDNSEGSIKQTGTDDLTLAMRAGIDNSKGEIVSNSTNLTVSTSDLNNQSGQINHTGQGKFALTADNLTNQKGKLLALNEQIFTVSNHIDNTEGTIQSKQFNINTKTLDNTKGTVTASLVDSTGTSSQLTASGDINNNKGNIISNTGNLAVTGKTITNAAGQLRSTNDHLTINSDELTNTQNASIYAGKNATITNKNGVTNQATIAAKGNTSITTDTFTQGDTGKLVAGMAKDGQLTQAGSNISVTSTGKQTNSGTNLATAKVTLEGSSLDLSQSTTSAKDLALTAKSGDIQLDTAKTTIEKHAKITATGGLSNNKGNLQAESFEFAVASLSNVEGTINQLGEQDFNLTTTGDINNKQGNISVAGKNLTLSSQGSLDNTNGQVTHTGTETATINAKELNNTQGKLLTNADLSSTVSNTLDNSTGVLQAKSVKLTANKLLNNNGSVVTTEGDMTLNTADIDNNGDNAKIQSHQALTINNSGSITNQNKAIISAKTTADITTANLTNAVNSTVASEQKLNVTASHLLDNAGNIGSIKDAVSINANTLSNQNGATISGEKSVTIDATESMTNAGDLFSTQDAMTVSTKTLNNQANANISGKQKVTVDASTAISNGGHIHSKDDSVSLKTAQLDNQADASIVAKQSVDIDSTNINNQGTISSTDATLTVESSDTLNNANGVLSGAAVALTSKKDINNQQGLISQTDANQTLTIKATDSLDNQDSTPTNGKQLGIIANGDATMNVGGLNNNSGLISSNKLTMTVTGSDAINNQQGKLTAKTDLDLTAQQSSAFDNQGGKVTADKVNLTVGNASAKTGSINNSAADSLIQAKELTINTGTLDNQNTKQAEDVQSTQGVVATDKATIHVARLNNQSGQVLSENSTTINVSDSVNNNSGLLKSNDSLTILDTAKQASLINTGGVAKAKILDITAKNYDNNQGQLTANTLNIDVADSITHDANSTIKADDLTIKTVGDFTNNNELSAQNINLTASNITNNTDAKIVSENTTDLTASNTMNNYGMLNGANTYLNAYTVNNNGGARIYGDHVAIKATTFNNTFNGASSTAPVVAARQRLDLGVQTLNNNPNDARSNTYNSDFNGQAQIISNGDMHIGGDLDANHHATGTAGTINNTGATIQSVGDMVITASKVENNNASFAVAKEDSSGASHRYEANGKVYSEDDIIIRTFGDIGMCGGSTGVNDENCGGHAAFRKSDGKAIDFDDDEGEGVDAYGNVYVEGEKYYRDQTYPFFGDMEVTGQQIKEVYISRENGGYGGNYYEYDLHEERSEDKVISSDPSRIVSGGEMTLNATEVKNTKSQLISKGIAVTGDNVINDGRQGERTIVVKGKKFLRTITEDGDIDKHKDEAEDISEVVQEHFDLHILKTDTQSADVKPTDTQVATVESLTATLKELKILANAINEAQKAHKTNKDLFIKQIKAIDEQTLNAIEAADSSGLTDAQKQSLKDLLYAGRNGKPINTAKLGNLIAQLNKVVDNPNQDVRTVGNATTLPNSSLYIVNPNSQAGYLVETDPNFTDSKNWLSSDYMRKQLKFDPAITQKRIGDGYYEQQLIRDQIMSLTGRRYLGDYQNEQNQYQGLMNAGIRMAQQLQLRPGIALTSAQMAQLTTDIVWLVEETVTLADGSTQKVLVPKVYTKQAKNAIDGTGTLIAADKVTMDLKGDLDNSANFVAHKGMKLSVETLNNHDAGLIKSDYVDIQTKKDLNNKGGKIRAENAMRLKVDGKLNNETTTYTTESKFGSSTSTRTGVAQVGSIEVGKGLANKRDGNGNPITTLITDVKGDITMKGGIIKNDGGNTFIKSREGDIKFDAIKTKTKTTQTNFSEERSRDVGSNINSLGNLVMQGKNITGTATNINSENGTTYMKAEKNIDFKEGRNILNRKTSESSTSFGLFSGVSTTSKSNYLEKDTAIKSRIGGKNMVMQAGNDVRLQGTDVASGDSTFIDAGHDVKVIAATNKVKAGVSKKEKKQGFMYSSESSASTDIEKESAANSSVYGGRVSIKSGNDINVKGVEVRSQKGTTLDAKNEVKLEAAKEHYKSTSKQKEKKSGFSLGEGASVFMGVKNSDKENETEQLTHKGSVISALDGNVNIKAKKYTQIGSELKAQNQEFKKGEVDGSRGNIHVEAEEIDTKDVIGHKKTNSNEVSRQFGLTGGVDSALLNGVATELQENLLKEEDTAQDEMNTSIANYVEGDDANLSGALKKEVKEAKAARKKDEEKSTADWVTKGTGYAKQGAEVVKEIIDIKDSRAYLVLGYKQTNKRNKTYDESSTKSAIKADGNVTMVAKGADENSNINLRGVDFDVKNDTILSAENQVNWSESKLKSTKHTEEDSFGAQIGGFAKLTGAAGVTAKIEGSTEDSKINKTSYTDSQVNIGNRLTINSGGDTNIKGVAVNAKSAGGKIGGNMNIESLQEEVDHEHYKLGGSLGVDVDLVKTTGTSVSLGLEARGIKSGFKGVTKRAGIFTGDDGFDFKVDGKTNLKGAAITTTEEAIKAGKNKFDSKGGIESQSLINHKYKLGAGVKAGGTFGVEEASLDDLGFGLIAGGATGKTTAGISGLSGNTELTTDNQKTYDNRYTVELKASGARLLTGQASFEHTGEAVKAYDGEELEKGLRNQIETTSNLFGMGKAAKDGYSTRKSQNAEKRKKQTEVVSKFQKAAKDNNSTTLSDKNRTTVSKMISVASKKMAKDKAASSDASTTNQKQQLLKSMKQLADTATKPSTNTNKSTTDSSSADEF